MRQTSTPPHPYAELFPLHVGQPLWDMSDDIKKNGQQEPILLYQDKILDGRRRELACFRAEVEPKYKQFKGDDKQALALVISRNLHRRHLGEGERSLIAAKIANMKAGDNQHITKKEVPPIGGTSTEIGQNSQANAAAALNVSERSVSRAKKVLDSGTPELVKAVEAGDVSVSDAAKIASEPAKVQNEAVKKVRKKKAKTVKAAVDEIKSDEPKEQPKDEWGIPIQPHAAKAFESCIKFDELIGLLKKADKLFSEICDEPGGAYLCRPGIAVNARDRWRSSQIATALLNAKDCKPTYTVCPRAYHAKAFPDSKHIHNDTCTLCRGLNWSRPLGKNEVQPETIAAAKESLGCSI